MRPVACMWLALAAAGMSCGRAPATASAPASPTPGGEFDVPALSALPPVSLVPGNPVTRAKAELGRHLFFDLRLSADGEMACATCHDPTQGWGDGREISGGYPGTRHWRNAPTVVNAAYLQRLFWDGGVDSLEAQAGGALTGNLDANGDPIMIEERLAQIPAYVQMFRDAFDAPRPTFDLALQAIASFERATCISTDSPFDRYMRGEATALSTSALRGKALFEGKARCIGCHNGPLLTDERYHATGVPRNPFFERDVQGQISLRYQHRAREVPDAVYRAADRDLGRYYETHDAADRGRFRTAPLRYLAYTAPYMHNGAFLVLEEIVEFYNRGGGDPPNKSPLLRPLGLTALEQADLLAFLASLSGAEIRVERPRAPPYVATER